MTNDAPLDEDNATPSARDVELYRAVFEVNAAVKLLIDPETGAIVDANEGAATFYGYAKAELRTMNIAELNVLPSELIRQEMERARAERRSFFRFRHRVASGEVRDVEVYSGPFVWSGRTLLLSIVHDVTERYRLEDRLARAQTLEAMGRLAGGVAHDFNNLLTVILGFSEAIADGSRKDERAQVAARHVVQAATRAAELTQKLLAFGRKRIENPTNLSLNALIRDLEAVLREMAGANASLVVELDDDLGRVYADHGTMVQVLTNLVHNAGEATEGRGHIRLTTTRMPLAEARQTLGPPHVAGVRLTVEDDGPGIAPGLARQIFEPFVSTKQRGSGLGLATVYGIVQQSGGTISVQSEPGHTTFTVCLPVAIEGASTNAVPSSTTLGTRPRTLRVLFAEDDAAVRHALTSQLEGLGHVVTSSEDGEQALARFVEADGMFDVLVTDVRMPRMNGIALATAIRARAPGLPVVYVTGDHAGLLDDAVTSPPRTRAVGKPCTSEALDQAIRAVIA